MIEINHLIKSYGQNTAVDDISLKMEKGKIYGLLGPNGAGKSTTMNIMTGFIGATSGTVTINGYDIFKESKKAKQNIGYLPEIPPLYPDMTVNEYLKFVAELKGLKKDTRSNELDRVCRLAQIEDVRERLIRKLSKGYKQRVGFAQALIGDPEIIILDEPTVGLDPIQINEFRDTIRSLRENHIVIISSHILAEIAEVCDYVFIISKGELVLSDSIDMLNTHFNKTHTLNIVAKGDASTARDILKAMDNLDNYDVTDGKEAGTVNIMAVTSSDIDLREKLSVSLSGAGMIIFEMKESEESLEDIFMQITTSDDVEPVNYDYDSDDAEDNEADNEAVNKEEKEEEE